MSRRSSLDPIDDAQDFDPGALDDRGARVAPDLAALPVVGITRRRVAILASTMLAAWIVIAFARQVGEVSAASARAQDIASANAALRIEVGALERELDLIARQRYIEQQGRAYGLGGPREIAFTLEKDAPALPDDAPGSAALRVGAQSEHVTPLERWLTVLFGPSD
jgi:cell division protein FtsB